MKRWLLAVLLLLVGVTWWWLEPAQFLTLEALQERQADLANWRDARPLLAAAAFFLLYVSVTAVSIPGAAVMTLAAGAFFGLLWGTVLVSFASTIGATLAFLVSRFLLHDTVQRRFGDRLAAVNRGMARDGAFYLFTLRLVPLFPFFVINLLMGLTPIRVWTYFWVSQVGMLAATVVYVNAGTQLAQLESLRGILSPTLLLSFVLLGIFPLLARRIVSWVQRRRAYRGWKRPRRFDRNLVVIGAGAAGLVSAYIAATVRAKVTLVEAHKMGGDCLNYGCVPSKALIRTARLAQQMRRADSYGLLPAEPQLSFARVMQRVHDIIAQVEPHDSIERYEALGVDVVQGHARLIDPWTVEITRHDGDVQRLTTRAVIIAAGAAPVVPDLPGIEDSDYVTSDTLWERFATLSELPRRIAVLGGGPIGCELAQAFARLGAEVTQIERGERLLAREDPEVSAQVRLALTRDGVRVLTGHIATRCEAASDAGPSGGRLVLDHAGSATTLDYDALICAVGRRPRLTGYGLETLGIAVERTVVTNEYLETLYPNILAAGDVAGPYQFTHVAAHQAWYAAVNALFGQVRRFKADYRVIPHVTFVDPEVARVGVSETEARAQGLRFEVTRYGIDDLDRAIADSEAEGFVKVITAQGSDRILGVTIVGSHAGELLAEFVLAMKHGLGLNKVLGTIHTYPTWSEANKYAAGAWKKAHAPERLLRWVQRYHSWRRG